MPSPTFQCTSYHINANPQYDRKVRNVNCPFYNPYKALFELNNVWQHNISGWVSNWLWIRNGMAWWMQWSWLLKSCLYVCFIPKYSGSGSFFLFLFSSMSLKCFILFLKYCNYFKIYNFILILRRQTGIDENCILGFRVWLNLGI